MDRVIAMNELETFAKFTLDSGGVWFTLEKSDDYTLFKTQDRYLHKNNYYYDTPIYQIFNADGKRIFAGTDYLQAYNYYKKLMGGN